MAALPLSREVLGSSQQAWQAVHGGVHSCTDTARVSIYAMLQQGTVSGHRHGRG